MNTRGTETEWIEGFPAEPGDYLFCRLVPGYPSLSRVELGRSFYTGNDVLTHVAGDFLYASVNQAPAKLWHMPITLPALPPMNRSCPECTGTECVAWRCRTCSGKGEI